MTARRKSRKGSTSNVTALASSVLQSDARDTSTRDLDDVALAALIDFFELLDRWDRETQAQ